MEAPVSKIHLRSTQPLAISMAREEIVAGRDRLVICAPCGFGKSIIACKYFESARLKGRKVWFVVDRQNLVNQMSNHLERFGISHGVMMAGHEKWDASNMGQVASIQTLEKRGWSDDIDLMLVDEGHALMRKSFIDYAQMYPKTRIISFTATPFHPSMGEVYQSVINPTTVNKQIDEGNLVPLRIFQCVEADMNGAKTSGGEWTDQEVTTRGRKIIGDIVTTWEQKTMEHFGKPVKTIIFPSTIAHGQEISDSFAAAGYNFKVVSCRDNSLDKELTIEEFRKTDKYHGLISCGVLTRGFDVTDIQIGIMARPFRKAFSEFIQEIGRVQRAHTWADGTVKQYGLLLDHAGNVARFKDEMVELFENGVDSLADPADAKPPRKDPPEKEKKELFCPKCKILWDFPGDVCQCGFKRSRPSKIEIVAGKMVEVLLNGKKLADDTWHLYQQVCTYTKASGNPATAKQRAFYLYRDMAGKQPPNTFRFEDAHNVPITQNVANKIKQQRIAYAKRRSA